jgi:hypothetical protein
MKKTLFFVVACGFLCAGFVFGADSYSVQRVAGPVCRLGAAGQWIAVSEGDALSAASIIRIGFNAALVVKNGDTEQTLRSTRQGALESFLSSGAAGAEGRISVGGRAPVRNRNLDWAE